MNYTISTTVSLKAGLKMTGFNLDSTKKFRKVILAAELAAYMHDLGKLSWEFQNKFLCDDSGKRINNFISWEHEEIIETDKDKQVLEDQIYQALSNRLDDLLGIQNSHNLVANKFVSLSIRDLVTFHHKPAEDIIQQHYNSADRLESAEEQGPAIGDQVGNLCISNVFGFDQKLEEIIPGFPKDETDRIKYFEIKRGEFYRATSQLLDMLSKINSFDALMYFEKFTELTRIFDGALGKTQRQINDTTLYQHSWGVASRFKAFLTREILIADLQSQSPNQTQDTNQTKDTFRFMSITWDSWKIITPHARLIDLLARQQLLERLRNNLRWKIEFEYAFGSRVYEDHDGIYFMVPDLNWDKESIELEIGKWIEEETKGEISWKFGFSEGTNTIIRLVEYMKSLRATGFPLREPSWLGDWKEEDREICPVCHKRPLHNSAEVCEWCLKQRGLIKPDQSLGGTVWNGEVADRNGKTALVVARFDLEKWINGEMLESVYLTQPTDHKSSVWSGLLSSLETFLNNDELIKTLNEIKINENKLTQLNGKISVLDKQLNFANNDSAKIGIQNTINIKQSEISDLEKVILQYESELPDGKSSKNLAALLKIFNNLVRQPNFKMFAKEYVGTPPCYLKLLHKYPTAGRIFSIWQTTQGFFEEQKTQIFSDIKEKNRLKFTLNRPLAGGFHTLRLPDQSILEVYCRGNNQLSTVEALEEERQKKISKIAYNGSIQLIKSSDANKKDDNRQNEPLVIIKIEDEKYKPYRIIGQSPNLIMALVPADQAIPICKKLRGASEITFNKVQGRMPLNMAVIFMQQQYPMFAALDAARRMSGSLEEISRKGVEASLTDHKTVTDGVTLKLESIPLGKWVWKIDTKLGNGREDQYHPYQLIKTNEIGDDSPESIAYPGFCWRHVSQLKPGDTITLWPSLFAYLYLDSVSTRIHAQIRPLPNINTLEREKPTAYILNRIDDFDEVMKAINSHNFTPNLVRSITELLLQKRKDWEFDQNHEVFSWLVDCIVNEDLAGDEILKQAIRDGVYFDAIELHQHILKTDSGLFITSAVK